MDFSTELTIPLILIAVGGLVLITQRNRWLVMGALFAQWLGLVWQVWLLPVGKVVGPVEIVTALGCWGIMGLTVWSLERKKDTNRGRLGSDRYAIADQLWLWAIAVVAGVAGFGLARLYPLGGSEQDLTAFYWIMLPALLALVINGSRDFIKLGVGMLTLINAGLFLVYVVGASSPTVGLLGLAALGRLALAAIIGYSWLCIKATYLDLDLNVLFDLRDSKVGLSMALVPMPDVNSGPESGDVGDTESGGDDEGVAEGDEAALDGEAEEVGSGA
jgi:hypothetical protein